MDEIITIVIVAAAIIFKVVSKKLGSATGDEVFPTIPVDPDMMKEMDTLEEQLKRQKQFYTTETVPVDEMVVEEAEPVLSVKPDSPILVEEQPKQREKIDPKKLVVYSEIMKPKYME